MRIIVALLLTLSAFTVSTVSAGTEATICVQGGPVPAQCPDTAIWRDCKFVCPEEPRICIQGGALPAECPTEAEVEWDNVSCRWRCKDTPVCIQGGVVPRECAGEGEHAWDNVVCAWVCIPTPPNCVKPQAPRCDLGLASWNARTCLWSCPKTCSNGDNPAQCLIDPCRNKNCAAGEVCVANACNGFPTQGAGPCTAVCKRPVNCFADPCSVIDTSKQCPHGCQADYTFGCDYRCKAAPTCKFGDKIYQLDESRPDDCNTCSCTARGWMCTLRACVAPTTPVPVACTKNPCDRPIASGECKFGCKADYSTGCNYKCLAEPVGDRCAPVTNTTVFPTCGDECLLVACPGDQVCRHRPCTHVNGCGAQCIPPPPQCQDEDHIYEIGQTRKQDCNTCTCTKTSATTADWACTEMACQQSNCISNEGAIVAPGQTFKRQCNNCQCGNDGQVAGCTRMGCMAEGCYDDAGVWYKEGATKKRDCNTCTCMNGSWGCTKMGCPATTAPPSLPPVCIDKCPTMRCISTHKCVFNPLTCESKCQLRNFCEDKCPVMLCAEGTVCVFNRETCKSTCETRICPQGGPVPKCPFDLEAKWNPKSCRFECPKTCISNEGNPVKPGTGFMMGCNSCQCTASGDVGMCTLMFCMDEGVCYDDAGKMYREGETIKRDCNIGTCRGGVWAFTEKACAPTTRPPLCEDKCPVMRCAAGFECVFNQNTCKSTCERKLCIQGGAVPICLIGTATWNSDTCRWECPSRMCIQGGVTPPNCAKSIWDSESCRWKCDGCKVNKCATVRCASGPCVMNDRCEAECTVCEDKCPVTLCRQGTQCQMNGCTAECVPVEPKPCTLTCATVKCMGGTVCSIKPDTCEPQCLASVCTENKCAVMLCAQGSTCSMDPKTCIASCKPADQVCEDQCPMTDCPSSRPSCRMNQATCSSECFAPEGTTVVTATFTLKWTGVQSARVIAQEMRDIAREAGTHILAALLLNNADIKQLTTNKWSVKVSFKGTTASIRQNALDTFLAAVSADHQIRTFGLGTSPSFTVAEDSQLETVTETLAMQSCQDGSEVSASIDCPATADVFAAPAASAASSSSTPLVIIIVPIVAGIVLLAVIATVVVVMRRRQAATVKTLDATATQQVDTRV